MTIRSGSRRFLLPLSISAHVFMLGRLLCWSHVISSALSLQGRM